MRYAVATVGAVLIFVGTLFLCLLPIAFVPGALEFVIRIGNVEGNPLGGIALALACLAAYHSYRSTLSRYEQKSSANPPPASTDSQNSE
jgi:hypothetical protein